MWILVNQPSTGRLRVLVILGRTFRIGETRGLRKGGKPTRYVYRTRASKKGKPTCFLLPDADVFFRNAELGQEDDDQTAFRHGRLAEVDRPFLP